MEEEDHEDAFPSVFPRSAHSVSSGRMNEMELDRCAPPIEGTANESSFDDFDVSYGTADTDTADVGCEVGVVGMALGEGEMVGNDDYRASAMSDTLSPKDAAGRGFTVLVHADAAGAGGVAEGHGSRDNDDTHLCAPTRLLEGSTESEDVICEGPKTPMHGATVESDYAAFSVDGTESFSCYESPGGTAELTPDLMFTNRNDFKDNRPELLPFSPAPAAAARKSAYERPATASASFASANVQVKSSGQSVVAAADLSQFSPRSGAQSSGSKNKKERALSQYSSQSLAEEFDLTELMNDLDPYAQELLSNMLNEASTNAAVSDYDGGNSAGEDDLNATISKFVSAAGGGDTSTGMMVPEFELQNTSRESDILDLSLDDALADAILNPSASPPPRHRSVVKDLKAGEREAEADIEDDGNQPGFCPTTATAKSSLAKKNSAVSNSDRSSASGSNGQQRRSNVPSNPKAKITAASTNGATDRASIGSVSSISPVGSGSGSGKSSYTKLKRTEARSMTQQRLEQPSSALAKQKVAQASEKTFSATPLRKTMGPNSATTHRSELASTTPPRLRGVGRITKQLGRISATNNGSSYRTSNPKVTATAATGTGTAKAKTDQRWLKHLEGASGSSLGLSSQPGVRTVKSRSTFAKRTN